MTSSLLDTSLVQSIGWALIHFVWQGTVIGIATAIALRILVSFRSTVRYAVACLSLMLMLIVPVVAVLSDRASDSTSLVSVASVASVMAPASLDRLLPSAVVVWLTGVVLLSLRLTIACARVERLKRATRAIDAKVVARVQWLACRFGIGRPVRVVESTLVRVPTVVGYLRPVILLPASVITGLAPAYLDAVLAHELAHVRRHDYLVNLLQSLVETLLFYHPAVWWCSRQIRIEREHCCDDMVVEAGGNRVAYAAALTQLEELRGLQPMLSLNASGGRLIDRIRRLLAESPMKERRSTTWTIAAALAVVTAIVVAPGRTVVNASSVAVTNEQREVQPVPQPAPQSQAQAQPQAQPQPQPAPQPRVRRSREAQPWPEPPSPPAPPPAPLAAPVLAPAAPVPPLPPNSQVAVPAPAPPAPPAPPREPLGLDADALHEAMRGAMEQIAESLKELRQATEDVGLKQEAIRQAQEEIAKMRVDALASRKQMELMQQMIDELNKEISKLRVR